MPVKGFYFVYGDDADMIEKRYIPDLEKKYQSASWLRYDATIDDIRIGSLTTEYNANDLFADSKVIVIRNADAKFWKEQQRDLRKLEAADREAQADFWLEYQRLRQRIAEDSRPSNLKFGLL